jgi:hypothetical protein
MDKQVAQTPRGEIMSISETFADHEGSKNQSDWKSPRYDYQSLQIDQSGVDRIGYGISPDQKKFTINREFPPNTGSEIRGYVCQKDIEIHEPIEPIFPEHYDNSHAGKFK